MSGKARDWNRDPLSETDQQYRLCRLTQLSTAQILGVFAEAHGDTRRSVVALRIRKQNLYTDNGIWNMYRGWVKFYVPQWEQAFMDTMKNALVANEDQFKSMMTAAAKALNISPELLTHYAVHQEEIELFLRLQRHTLGTMAEAKLWELVAAGDAATIRWVLPRIKAEIFGEQEAAKVDNTRSIRIIDVGDE